MSKHPWTPGPWIRGGHGGQRIRSASSTRLIATAAVVGGRRFSPERKANARLISAAPTLYETASNLLDRLNDIDPSQRAVVSAEMDALRAVLLYVLVCAKEAPDA